MGSTFGKPGVRCFNAAAAYKLGYARPLASFVGDSRPYGPSPDLYALYGKGAMCPGCAYAA